MSLKLKKEHLTNWDLQQYETKSNFNDDNETYISERTSPVSLESINPLPNVNKQPLPVLEKTPSPVLHRSPLPKPVKPHHTLRYPYNEVPENGIPIAVQYQQAKQEEKERRKNFRKAPPGQGTLATLPKHRQEFSSNYYPYWYYTKATNPDWIMRHRQTDDGQLLPYEHVDPSKYIPHPSATTSDNQSHKKHHYEGSNKQHRPVRKDTQLKPTEYYQQQQQQKSKTDHYIPLKDETNKQNSTHLSAKKRRRLRRAKRLESANDWNNHYLQSMSRNASVQDINYPKSNSNMSKYHSETTHNVLPNENTSQNQYVDQHHPKTMQHTLPNENTTRHHHHHHSPSHSHHHHHHRHHHRSPHSNGHHHHSSTKFLGTEFNVSDTSFKKFERTQYFQSTENLFQSPPPAIYEQSSYLPPIQSEVYHRSSPTDSYYYIPNGMNNYHTQTVNSDWREPIKSPKIYKAQPETTFYDRYLNKIVLDKLKE